MSNAMAFVLVVVIVRAIRLSCEFHGLYNFNCVKALIHNLLSFLHMDNTIFIMFDSMRIFLSA